MFTVVCFLMKNYYFDEFLMLNILNEYCNSKWCHQYFKSIEFKFIFFFQFFFCETNIKSRLGDVHDSSQSHLKAHPKYRLDFSWGWVWLSRKASHSSSSWEGGIRHIMPLPCSSVENKGIIKCYRLASRICCYLIKGMHINSENDFYIGVSSTQGTWQIQPTQTRQT